MNEKIKVSIEWLSGCCGCECAIVDMHDKLLQFFQEIELVRIPFFIDTKNYPPAAIGMITGSIRTDHDVKAAREMRQTCRTIVALGTCPVYGGPHSGAYAHSNRELLERAFVSNPSTRTRYVPEDVPELLEGNRPLDTEIAVDAYLPGCPPHPAYIFEGLTALLNNREPEIGRRNVCFYCTRKMCKSDICDLRRIHEGTIDPDICFLSQGILCFGSVTLDRCMAPCPQVGTPCFSCGGPSEAIILEPFKDVRTMVATRMAHLTRIAYDRIVAEIEKHAKTHYAYAMVSPVFRSKPTFLLKKWVDTPKAAKGA